jgi:hypothetical protein
VWLPGSYPGPKQPLRCGCGIAYTHDRTPLGLACSETAWTRRGTCGEGRNSLYGTIFYDTIHCKLVSDLVNTAPLFSGACETPARRVRHGQSVRATWQPAEKKYYIGDTSLVSGGRSYDTVRYEVSYLHLESPLQDMVGQL